jgi:competence protein ComEA
MWGFRDIGGGFWEKGACTGGRSAMLKCRKWVVLWIAAAFIVALVTPLYGQEGKININEATVEELAQLKNIGPGYAQRIVQYREENGAFEKAEDILKVKGIGLKTWELNKDRIIVKAEQ